MFQIKTQQEALPINPPPMENQILEAPLTSQGFQVGAATPDFPGKSKQLPLENLDFSMEETIPGEHIPALEVTALPGWFGAEETFGFKFWSNSQREENPLWIGIIPWNSFPWKGRIPRVGLLGCLLCHELHLDPSGSLSHGEFHHSTFQ